MTFIAVTRGLPGSGKSTWADGIIKVLKNVVKVERDEIRQQLFKSYWTGNQEDEELVTRLQESLVRTYLVSDVNVIISDTHLPDRSVKKWLKLGKELNVEVLVQDFRDVPLDDVLELNEKRKWRAKYVDPEVIRYKYNRFIKGRDLTKEVTYTPAPEAVIEPYVPRAGTKPAYIFDIDGTLAVLGDRSPYDYTKYSLDTANKDVHAALNNAELAGYQIIIVSGRDETYRFDTEKWLAREGICYHALYMRPTENRKDGKKTEDSIIKYNLFNKYIRDNFTVAGVYDDRHRVLRMWRKLGLTTFHVNGPDAGNF